MNAKVGKVNPKVVKALIKVVIDDTKYEICSLGLYVDYLKDEIKRLEEIGTYINKMNKANDEANREYYANGAKYLLQPGETFENYEQVLEEYKQAYVVRKEDYDKLKEELNQIKKLRI